MSAFTEMEVCNDNATKENEEVEDGELVDDDNNVSDIVSLTTFLDLSSVTIKFYTAVLFSHIIIVIDSVLIDVYMVCYREMIG